MAGKKSKATIPRITEAAIRSRVGEASFKRGQGYVRDEMIHTTKRRGTTLEARSEGSSDETYRLQATFDSKGVETADCSCPVGDAGHCKHVAAMLLTWLSRPEDFVETEEIGVILERRSKVELIELIGLMIRQVPDLEDLIEMTHRATEAGKRAGPPSTELYKRRAIKAFRSAEYTYGADPAADELETLVEIGDAMLEQGDPLGASAVYRGILEGVFEEYESYGHGDDEIHTPAEGCSLGLGLCLSQLAEHREPLFRSLFELYAFDVKMGGMDFGGDPIEIALKHATEAETAMIAGWTLDASRSGSRPYERKSFEHLYRGLARDGDIRALDPSHESKAAEASEAREAIRVYSEQVAALIGRRNRASYAGACRYLKKIKDLRKQLGETSEAAREIFEIRERFRPLRVLIEEMDRAGL